MNNAWQYLNTADFYRAIYSNMAAAISAIEIELKREDPDYKKIQNIISVAHSKESKIVRKRIGE